MHLRLPGLCGLALLASLAATPASAQIILGGEPVATPGAPAAPAPELKIDPEAAFQQADFKPVVFAIPDFAGTTPEEIAAGKRVADVIRRNLNGTGLFASADPAAYAAITADIAVMPAWASWEATGAQAIVIGKVIFEASGVKTVQFRVYDVAGRKQLIGTRYDARIGDVMDRLSHKASDDIYYNITGAGRYFDTRLAYVAEIGGKTQLGFVDQDGGATEQLTAGFANLRKPRLSHAGEQVIYSADAPIPGKQSQAQLTTILYDLMAGRREPLLAVASQPNPDARFSADGRSAIYSRKIGGNDEIVLLDIGKRTEKTLNASPASDTAPSLSPDGSHYVFVSNRDGSPQLYVARVDGADVACASGAAKACRISSGSGAYANPAWSPASGFIAFERKQGATTSIGVVKTDGSGETSVTSAAKDTGPAWSPNGRVIAFARETSTGGSKLWAIDRSGRGLREIPTPGDAWEPSWGAVRQ